MKITKEKLAASIIPFVWVLLALWDVGSPRVATEASTWTGEIVVVVMIFLIPVAVVAFVAGKSEGGGY